MENRLTDLEGRVQKLEENNSDVKLLVAVIKERLDTIVKTLDKLSSQYERYVVEVNEKYEVLNEKYDKLKEELNNKTVGKDADRWKLIITAIITGCVSILLGIVFSSVK